MSKPTAITYDTRDDRRELHRLLEYLSPARRLQFVRWCSQWCRDHGAQAVADPWPGYGRTYLAMEAFFDCFALAHQYSLDLDVATTKLTEMVRGKT